MPAQATVQQRDALKQAKVAPRFTNTTPPRCNLGEEVKCVLFDTVTKQPFVSAVADSEQKAFDQAMLQLPTAKKPMSPAELAVENKVLVQNNTAMADELTELRTRLGIDEDEVLSTAELVDQLDALSITLPKGDKRTKQWRDQAMNLLANDKEISG